MKADTKRKRSILGRAQSGFITTMAGWSAEGETRESAESALFGRLQRQQEALFTRRYVRAAGATFCLFYADGWHYDIVHDDGANHPSMTDLNGSSYATALTAMLDHVKQFNGGVASSPAVAAGNALLVQV